MLLVPVLGVREAATVSVVFSIFLLGSMSGLVFASSGNWVEVTRFTGGMAFDIYTEPFTCNHVEWRIRWNYSPEIDLQGKVSFAVFGLNVFDDESKNFILSTGGFGSKSESGTLSLSENGTFYMQIGAVETAGYSIIVEQNIDSIPEFPSWTLLPILIVTSLVVLIARNKLSKKGLE